MTIGVVHMKRMMLANDAVDMILIDVTLSEADMNACCLA
jgi:hypothetical protein